MAKNQEVVTLACERIQDAKALARLHLRGFIGKREFRRLEADISRAAQKELRALLRKQKQEKERGY